jgi:hypothetical protein
MSCFLECVLFITILPFYNRERERWRERERERERERTHTNTHTHTHTLEKKEARASELCHSNKNNQNKRYFVIVYFPSTLSPALCPQQLGSMPLPPLSPLPPLLPLPCRLLLLLLLFLLLLLLLLQWRVTRQRVRTCKPAALPWQVSRYFSGSLSA